MPSLVRIGSVDVSLGDDNLMDYSLSKSAPTMETVEEVMQLFESGGQVSQVFPLLGGPAVCVEKDRQVKVWCPALVLSWQSHSWSVGCLSVAIAAAAVVVCGAVVVACGSCLKHFTLLYTNSNFMVYFEGVHAPTLPINPCSRAMWCK